MFEIRYNDEGEILMIGRCDAAQEQLLKDFFAEVVETTLVECANLSYISSSGLGILFATQKRLLESQQELVMANLNAHLREVFEIAGFDQHFTLI